MYIFSPNQYKEFGNKYYEEVGCYFRFQESKKFGGLYKSRFIALGPCCEKESDLDIFFKLVQKDLKFGKIRVDLPLILDKEIMTKVQNKMTENGYKKVDYLFNDEITVLVRKENYALSKKSRQRVRSANKYLDFVLTDNPTDQQFEDAYNIYSQSADRISYKQKPIEALRILAKNGLLGLAYTKEKHEIVGFIIANISEILEDGKMKKIAYIVFSGTNFEGRKRRVGYALHDILMTALFNERQVEIIDLIGASRKMGRTYVDFKMKFANELVLYPGSYLLTVSPFQGHRK